MGKYSSNALRKEREESFHHGEQNLPSFSIKEQSSHQGDSVSYSLKEIAHDCLRGCVASGDDWANFLNISKSKISEWKHSGHVPQKHWTRIIKFWVWKRNERVRPTEEKLMTYFLNQLPDNDGGWYS